MSSVAVGGVLCRRSATDGSGSESDRITQQGTGAVGAGARRRSGKLGESLGAEQRNSVARSIGVV